ncbi:hypothetical protein [Candidatus Nitrotoga sp. M5]|uniref:hypothetical protein n=1 Tax=Candidatus Nitrotoga sp. M5 TaxID=2890409 RepID=UPI001EF3F748|nr:hypothetical protein [Candidatus Nitrotoga sp. M5]CAH1387040.1 conserved hypothetical protein [Candidatus Nitrotoga sp. M5]
MRIRLGHNLPDIARAMRENARQVPFALARALTKTAQDVQAAEKAAIVRVFDRPTPFAQRSVSIRPAKKAKLEAEVFLKGDGTRDSATRRNFLGAQVIGGERDTKRFEKRMVHLGYMRSGEKVVPGEAMALNSYGNISRAQIKKILKALEATNGTGTYNDGRRRKEVYFVSRGRDRTVGRRAWRGGRKEQHLPRGVWVRTRFALGSSVRPAMLFVDRAAYSRRLQFFTLAEQIAQSQFPMRWQESWDIARRTAQ